MKKTILAGLLLSLLSYAGDNGGGSISCKSGSGRTKLEGGAGVAYNGSGRASVTLTIDGKSIDFNTERTYLTNGVDTLDSVSFDEKLKVFTMKFSEIIKIQDYKDAWSTLELIADPASFKKTARDVFQFTAILDGLDPRKDLKNVDYTTKLDKPVQVSCTLDLSI